MLDLEWISKKPHMFSFQSRFFHLHLGLELEWKQSSSSLCSVFHNLAIGWNQDAKSVEGHLAGSRVSPGRGPRGGVGREGALMHCNLSAHARLGAQRLFIQCCFLPLLESWRPALLEGEWWGGGADRPQASTTTGRARWMCKSEIPPGLDLQVLHMLGVCTNISCRIMSETTVCPPPPSNAFLQAVDWEI